MKKILDCVVPVKAIAGMVFMGIICLYMVTGGLYAAMTGTLFDYAIPFIFIVQGLLLAVAASVLWLVIFNDIVIKKMRYFQRLMLFSVSLAVVFAVCLLTFMAIPTEWSRLWLTVNGCVAVGVVVFSVLGETYCAAIGKRYTETLKEYQSGRA